MGLADSGQTNALGFELWAERIDNFFIQPVWFSRRWSMSNLDDYQNAAVWRGDALELPNCGRNIIYMVQAIEARNEIEVTVREGNSFGPPCAICHILVVILDQFAIALGQRIKSNTLARVC